MSRMTAVLNWESMRMDLFNSQDYNIGTVEKSFKDDLKELYKEEGFGDKYPPKSSFVMYISIRRSDMSLEKFNSLARILTSPNSFAKALKAQMKELEFQQPIVVSTNTKYSSCSPPTSTANFLMMIASNTSSPQPSVTFDVWTGANGQFSTWLKKTLQAADRNLNIENNNVSSKQFKIYFPSPASSASADLPTNDSMVTE
jgi:hypothetical protein